MVAREHHFVPQFYLRAFSADGRRLQLFNFVRQRAIPQASIKNQCSRRNYYDFLPDLEQKLSNLEGESANVIRQIRQTNTLPNTASAERDTLLAFIFFQYLRTASSGTRTDVIGDYLAKLMLQGQPGMREIDLDRIRIRHKYPAAMPMSLVADVAEVAQDLKMHLFVNRTRREFITSDDPVVLHNQYCEGISYQGVLGWACRGLQAVFPLSPDHVVMLFDGGVYKVGDSHRGCAVTVIRDERDVDELNTLQIFNAQENVYFHGGRSGDVAEQTCRALSSHRPKTRLRFVETERLPAGDGQSSSLLHHYEVLLPLRFSLSSISLRRQAKRIPLHQRASLTRTERTKVLGGAVNRSGKDSRSYRVERIDER